MNAHVTLDQTADGWHIEVDHVDAVVVDTHGSKVNVELDPTPGDAPLVVSLD